MHRQLHPVTHCVSSGAKPKHGHFNRHSPDVTKVSAYLSGTSEDKVIQPQDYHVQPMVENNITSFMKGCNKIYREKVSL